MLGIAANTTASFFIKLSVTAPRSLPSFTSNWSAILNWPLWAGLIFYGATFLLYTIALTRLPLNVVHPVMTSGAIAAVALISVLVFEERLYWTTALGISFVMVGVALITIRKI